MQPINLLPPYIYDKARKRSVWIAWGAAVLASIIGFVVWASTIRAQLRVEQDRNEQAKTLKTEYDGYTTQINSEKTRIADIQRKHDFIVDARKWNDAWPSTYEMMRDLTSDQILLESMALDPQLRQRLDFTGFSATEMNIVRWWMLLRNNVDKFDSVVFSLPVKGYPGAGAANAGMAGGFGGPGMMGGYRGMMGAMPGGPPTSMGGSMGGRMPMGAMPGGPPTSMGGSMGGRMGGMPMASGAPPTAGVYNPRTGAMAGATAGGFGPAAGRGPGGDVGDTEVEGRRGINFTAYAMLKTPLAGGIPLPVWGLVAGPAGGMGMMGGYRGMMGGGVSGMPMGAMPGGPPAGMGGSGGSMGGSYGGMGGARGPKGAD
jgi:hypothetical protein